MKATYSSRNRVRKKDVPHVVAELKAIEAEAGDISPQEVVERARDPDSVMHSYFEWDDDRAAGEYRLIQARQIIRDVRITYARGDGDVTVPVFVNVVTEAEQEGQERRQAYESAERAMADPNKRDHVLRQAYSRLDYWVSQYEHLSEFAEVVKAAKKVRRGRK